MGTRQMKTFRKRVIPTLLVDGRRLVKTQRFSDPTYIGDPVNTVRIFNEKQVDELVVLDIGASKGRRGPQLDLLAEMAEEAFMPLAYGGGVRSVSEVRNILSLGFEKVILNSVTHSDPSFVTEASRIFGRSTLVGSIDVRRKSLGRQELVSAATTRRGSDPVAEARRLENLGVGEILLQSVDRDGTLTGFDLELIRRVTGAVKIPVVAAGGAATITDLVSGVAAGASAVAAGAMFVFRGPHRAVLISYPTEDDLAVLG